MAIFTYKFSDLPAGTYDTPPAGFKTTGAVGVNGRGGIDSVGLFPASSTSPVVWVRDKNFDTSKPIIAKIEQTQGTGVGLNVVGSGLFFGFSSMAKGFSISIRGSGVNYSFRINKHENNGAAISLYDQIYATVTGRANTALTAYFYPSTGYLIIEITHSTMSETGKKIKYCYSLPEFINANNVGVISGYYNANNASKSKIDNLVIMDQVALNEPGILFDSPVFNHAAVTTSTATLMNGFAPMYGSVNGVPVDIEIVGDQAVINTIPLDELLGGQVHPFTNNTNTYDLIYAVEPYTEFISDTARVLHIKQFVGPNGIVGASGYRFSSAIETWVAPNQSNKSILQNYITKNGYVVCYSPWLQDANGTAYVITDGSGYMTISNTSSTIDTVYLYTFAQNDYLRKFQITVSGTTIIDVQDVTASTKAFFSKYQAEYNTQYESNAYTVTIAGAISIDKGQYAIDTGAGFGSWTNAAGTVSVGDKVKLRNTSSRFKDRKVITTVTINGVDHQWLIRNKLDKQYELDFSKTPQQTIVEMVGYENDVLLDTSIAEIVTVAEATEGDKNTVAVIRGKGNQPYHGDVEFQYNRLDIANFEQYGDTDLEVNTTTVTPAQVVAAFNTKYNTVLTVSDFDFTEMLPTPDADGELYTLKPKDNPVYIGEVVINLKLV